MDSPGKEQKSLHGVAKLADRLAYVDFFYLDPDDLSEKKKETKSIIGAIITVAVPILVGLYVAELWIQNERTPPTVERSLEPAALNPPLNLSLPHQQPGYLINLTEPGVLQCDQVLLKVLGTKQDHVPVCPDVRTGVAYEAPTVAEESGSLLVSHKGADYGLDVTVDNLKDILIDKDGILYVTGKHKTYSAGGLDDAVYTSWWDETAKKWKDLCTRQWEISSYKDVRFSEWVNEFLVIVMQEPSSRYNEATLLMVWDDKKKVWKRSNQFQSHPITSAGVFDGELIVASVIENNDELSCVMFPPAVYTVHLSEFDVENGKFNFSQWGDLSDRMSTYAFCSIDSLVEWNGALALMGVNMDDQFSALIWDKNKSEIAQRLVVWDDKGLTAEPWGQLHLHHDNHRNQDLLLFGGWSVVSHSPQVTRYTADGESGTVKVGSFFAWNGTDIITFEEGVVGEVFQFLSSGEKLFIIGQYEDRSREILVDVNLHDRVVSTTIGEAANERNIHACTSTAEALYCVGTFFQINDVWASGIAVFSNGQWSPLASFRDGWNKIGFGSDGSAEKQYFFGAVSTRAQPLSLAPAEESLQIGEKGLSVNTYVVSMEEVEDNTIGDTHGRVQPGNPFKVLLPSVRADPRGSNDCNQGMKKLVKPTSEREFGHYCCFDPDDLESFKRACRADVPINVPIVLWESWPVFMSVLNAHGERDWVQLATNPSRLKVVTFEGFQLKTRREINSNKQSLAALFGQAAGTISILFTCAYLSKLALSEAFQRFIKYKRNRKTAAKQNEESKNDKSFLNPLGESKAST